MPVKNSLAMIHLLVLYNQNQLWEEGFSGTVFSYHIQDSGLDLKHHKTQKQDQN